MTQQYAALPYPGTLPASSIAFGGVTYTYASGAIVLAYINGTTGYGAITWRLLDYANQRLISDQEAELLGVAPQIQLSDPNFFARAAADPFVAGVMANFEKMAMVASNWAALDAANAAIAAAQAMLTSDNASLAAAQTTLTAAESTLSTDTANNAAAGVLASDQAAVTQAQGIVNGLTAKVAADQTALTNAQGQLSGVQAIITAIEQGS